MRIKKVHYKDIAKWSIIDGRGYSSKKDANGIPMVQRTSIGEIEKTQEVDIFVEQPEKFKQILEWDGLKLSDLID